MNDGEQHTQAEISELFGWSPAWLRKIELLGLLPDLQSEPRRGRHGRIYTDADLASIMWVALLRHAGVELSEMKEYVDLAKELTALLEKYRSKDGEKLRLAFSHRGWSEDISFRVDTDKISRADQARIGRITKALESKAHNITLKAMEWRFRMKPLFTQMEMLEKTARDSAEAMISVNRAVVRNSLMKNRLLALNAKK
jgi:DNA-binding transcriptional MerR regulator